jgi:DNA-binding response OmpR family regulator
MHDRTVLVVEDDPAISELVTELLDDAGYTVLKTNLGRRGLRLAQEHTPAVMLVNNRLPDMTGLDLLERLRGQDATRRIPVVLVSGRTPQITYDGSADRVLPMPFDIDVLLTHVEQLALSGTGSAA